MKLKIKIACGLAAAWLAGCAASAPTEQVGSNSDELAISPIVRPDAGCPGVGTVICINGGHWDPKLCRCVPPADAGCVQNVLCIKGTHWDPTQCKCVPDACISQTGGPCGGFTQNPCQCAPGLVCVPNSIPDIPGKCEPSRCCPVGFDMYKCQEPDGTSGFNCHNPQLACPSSLTCGGGCDFEVTGQCPVCDPIPCPAGQKFDPVQCKCVGCITAADCSGPLPQFCQVCADGTAACAHWACVAGQCQVATCP